MADSDKSLHTQHCKSDQPPLLLSELQTKQNLEEIPHWDLSSDSKSISRQFSFKNYPETLAFINAAAWIAQSENHHPDISFGYNNCIIRYSTHSAGGLSLFDFICAAKTDQLTVNE